jgi:FixJ family two-component response regulator
MMVGVIVLRYRHGSGAVLCNQSAEKGSFVATEPLDVVVDDDDSFRTALVESLESFGYCVRGFASAEEFIASNVEGLCDCVITDIHMPGMSGIDLKRLLTTRKCLVPVIMITARAEPELECRVAASGALCLIRKPFESNDLIDCLEKALKA